MSHSVVSQMENGARRIDVDELVALAAALGTTPSYLLTPEYTPESVRVIGTGTQEMSIEEYWSWITSTFDPHHQFPGDDKLTAQGVFDRLVRTRPAFDLENHITWKFDGDD